MMRRSQAGNMRLDIREARQAVPRNAVVDDVKIWRKG